MQTLATTEAGGCVGVADGDGVAEVVAAATMTLAGVIPRSTIATAAKSTPPNRFLI
jgi:hypothetical protein